MMKNITRAILLCFVLSGCATRRAGQYELRGTRDNFVLIVTNQTSKPNPAHLVVSIDGEQVVADAFELGEDFPGHVFVPHYFRLCRGKHKISARTADRTVTFLAETELRRKKWFTVYFWGDKFTSYESDEPIYFD